MAGNAEEAKNESDVTPPDSEEGKVGFDNDTLRGNKNVCHIELMSQVQNRVTDNSSKTVYYGGF